MSNTGIVTVCLLIVVFVGDVHLWDRNCYYLLILLFIGDIQHWDSYGLLIFLFVCDVQHWDSYCLSVNSLVCLWYPTGIITVCLLILLFIGSVHLRNSNCLSVLAAGSAWMSRRPWTNWECSQPSSISLERRPKPLMALPYPADTRDNWRRSWPTFCWQPSPWQRKRQRESSMCGIQT